MLSLSLSNDSTSFCRLSGTIKHSVKATSTIILISALRMAVVLTNTSTGVSSRSNSIETGAYRSCISETNKSLQFLYHYLRLISTVFGYYTNVGYVTMENIAI